MTRRRPLDRPITDPGRPDFDGYPDWSPGRLTEAELLTGYRHSIAQEPLERPLTPVIDESGLAYGEPISRGRSARWRILGNGD